MADFLKRFVEMAFILGLVWMVMNLSGCHSINGVGKDLQAVTSPYVQQ